MSSWIRRNIFGERVIEANADKGAFWRDPEKGPYQYKPDNIDDYFRLYKENDLIRAALDDLVEQSIGDGYYTTVETLSPKKKQNRAKEYIDEFGRVFNLDATLVNVTRCMLIAGFCPVETHLVKVPKENILKSSLKIVHPKTVSEIISEAGKVIQITQKVDNKPNVIKNTGFNESKTAYDGLAWFVYGQIANDPRGTSLVSSVTEVLNTLNDATADVRKILKRYLGPLGIWKTRGSTDAVRRAVVDRPQGYDIFIGKLTQEEVENPNFPQWLTIDPRVPFWEYIEYLDRRVYKHMRAGDMWYFKDATVASAQELEDIVQRHVHSIQRDVKRPVERFWFDPLTEMNALPEMPRLNFGIEMTGVEDINPSDFIVKGVELGIINDVQYFEFLRQIGIDITQLQQVEEEEPEEEEEPVEPEEPEEP